MKRFLSIFFVLPLVFVSCDLTMDEVSQDVNKPTQVHPKTILTQLCITTFGIEYYGVQPYRLAWQWDQRGGGGHFNFQRRNFISEYRRVTWCYDMIREAERLNDPRYIHLAAYFRASWIFDTTRLFGDVPLHRGCAGTLRRPELFAQIRSPGGDRGRAAAGACSGQRGPGGLRQYQNRRRCDLRRRHSQVASADQSLPPAHPDQLLDEADHRRGACRRTVRRHRRRSGGQPDHGGVVRQRHPRRKGQYGELQVLQRQQFRFVVPDLQVRRRLDAGSAGTCVCRNWPK